MTHKTLRDIKPGDRVYVVKQHRLGGTGGGEYETVTRVGRSYGYIDIYGREHAFSLDTGYSRDGQNLRVNQLGFDVYTSRAEFEKHEAYKVACLRLKNILDSDFIPRLRRFEIDEKTVTELLRIIEGEAK